MASGVQGYGPAAPQTNTGPLYNQSIYNPDAATAAVAGQYGEEEAKTGAAAGEQEATTAAQAAEQAAATQAGAQENVAAQQTGLGYSQLGAQTSEFGDVYGLLSGQIAGSSGSGGFGGSPTSAQPGITANSVYTPQQIAAQVNQSNATGIQGAQTQQRQEAQQMAGQGFGSRSPALAEMQQNAMSQAIANNAANSANIQYQAATGNAAQALGAQTQAQTGWYQAQQQDVARRALNEQYASSLASAIAGLSPS